MRRFLTPRWLLRHAALVVLVTGFLALGWWQIGRARQGNLLSFGYAVEWPLFALFVIFVWSREVRDELRAAPPPPRRSAVPEDLRIEVPVRQPRPVQEDAATRAYNEYLAWLATHPDARPGDASRPGSAAT